MPQRHGNSQSLLLVPVQMLAETSNCCFLLLHERLQPENAAYKEPLGGLAPPYAVCNKHAEVPECCVVGYHSIEGSVTHAMPDFLYVDLCICSFLILLLPQSCFPNQIVLDVADTGPRIQVSAFWT